MHMGIVCNVKVDCSQFERRSVNVCGIKIHNDVRI